MTMSAILSADDLNDFISPGVACIKPVETLPPKEPAEENPYEVTKEDKVQPENAPPAQISLTDCLACSGCVTSAEAVLVSLQSHTEVLNTLDAYPEIPVGRTSDTNVGQSNGASAGEGRVFVASVSPQVRASLAATYGISEKEAIHMISQFLSGPQGLRAGGKHGGGFTWIVDTNVLREAVLTLTADEVAESLASNGENGAEKSLPKRPILSSACPGWICYAEKTHPFILPHLSRLKSPQALAGTFLKSALSKALRVPASKIWHLAVMPCFDKKLEASREELTDASWRPENAPVSEVEAQTPVRDVDCVITSRELLTLASARGISLAALPLKALPQSYTPKFPDDTLNSFLFSKRPQIEQSTETSSSGGYLHHVLKTFQARNPGSDIVTQRGRNADVVEYTLVSPSGESILKAARYYGFRNIQNLVRKLKPARASRLPGAKAPAAGNRRMPMSRNAAGSAGPEYAYVEVMACPGGCTNGGGQIRIEDARELNDTSTVVSNPEESAVTSSKPSPHEQRAWLARVDEAYYSAESESDSEPAEPSQPVSLTEKQARIHEALGYWSKWIDVPLSKLIYTTYREVESDVGKEKNAPDDTTRVVELAGKIGGGW